VGGIKNLAYAQRRKIQTKPMARQIAATDRFTRKIAASAKASVDCSMVAGKVAFLRRLFDRQSGKKKFLLFLKKKKQKDFYFRRCGQIRVPAPTPPTAPKDAPAQKFRAA
jgi:hypothetical protein